MLTIFDYKTQIAPKLHGASLAKVVGVFNKFHEAASNIQLACRPYTTIRRASIANAIYDHVYNYVCEDDCEANSIIDIRPVGVRSSKDSLRGSFAQQFDITKGENTFTVEYINGVKTLRLSKVLKPRSILYEADSLTSGVVVTASGDAENVRIDEQDFVSGGASVKFDVTGATGQAKITIVLTNAIDMTTFDQLGAVFPWVKFPVASALTNYKIRIGSSASDYYESTSTAPLSGGAFQDAAWSLLIENLLTAVATGTPDFSKVNFIQVETNYIAGTSHKGLGLDNITAAIGEAWEVVYYSNRMFTDSTGTTWKETPTKETDLVRLEGSDSSIMLYEFMLTLQQELKGKNMGADFTFFDQKLNGKFGTRGVLLIPGLYEGFKYKYPNQAVNRQIDYYVFGNLDGESGEGPGRGDIDKDDW